MDPITHTPVMTIQSKNSFEAYGEIISLQTSMLPGAKESVSTMVNFFEVDSPQDNDCEATGEKPVLEAAIPSEVNGSRPAADMNGYQVNGPQVNGLQATGELSPIEPTMPLELNGSTTPPSDCGPTNGAASTLQTSTITEVNTWVPVKIRIPDLFELFMSRPPTINPLYEKVRVQALEWANK
jgi:hypothetical protein